MASTSEIAAAWGCSRQAVSKWVRKGMPTESIAAATSWRMNHGERSARVKLLPQIDPPAPALDDDGGAPAALTNPDSPEASRDMARKAERVSYALLQEQIRLKDLAGIHAALKNYNVSRSGRAAAELDFIKHQKEAGALVDRFSSINAQNRKLGALRDLVLSLPEAVAKRCNPSDPDLAALVLQEWAEGTLRVASES
jgi:phage terminase Nu1 subunit (DNA packaging protein)